MMWRVSLVNATLAAVGLIGGAATMVVKPSAARAQGPANASFPQDSPRIANGTPAEACNFPSIVCMGAGSCGCTGTLVHPQLVLYAAHCGERSQITLGESGSGGQTVSVKTSMVHPDYDINLADDHAQIAIDWAFAVLEEPVEDVPITPAVFGCEAEMIVQEGGEIYQIGFGAPNSGQKYWKANTIRKLYDGVIETAGGGVGCPGDSGGPLLMRLPDKSWRTVGVTSTLMPLLEDCGQADGYNNYSRIGRDMIAWVEMHSEIDITPCYTLDGVFEPSEACTNFFAADPTATGTWDDQCAAVARVEDNTNCLADEEAPNTAIVAPTDQEHVESDTEIAVEVTASDDVAVVEVVLQVDGTDQESRDAPPFEWKLEPLAVGKHTLQAIAKDAAGNEGKSEKVVVIVDGEDDDTQSSDETSTESENSEASDGTDESGEEESSGGDDDDDGEKTETDEGDDDDDNDASDDDDDASEETPPEGDSCAFTAIKPGWGSAALSLVAWVWLRRSRRHLVGMR